MNAWMIYGPFDLSDALDAELLFYYWNESETGADLFKYYASSNGTSFYGYGVSGSTGGWNYVNFDLTNVYSIGNLCGDSSVWIAFKFDSDSINSYKGAFVDDIILQKTTGTEPNLTPYQPSGWADKIVVSNHQGDNDDDSPLYSTDTLYIDWAVINNGAVATDDTFYTRLYVDGLLEATFSTPSPLEPTWYAYISDYSLGSLSAGSHTIKIVADYDDQITESDESDNEYQRTINIEVAANAPQISSISPDIDSAGTDTAVTINGSNFGATQGSSKVEFFYKSGQPKIEAPIISWSDAQIQCIIPVDTVNGYPASSSSGPVTVTTENGTSNGYIFKVTFGYGEVEWSDTHPWILYEINENTSDCTGEGSAVSAGANEWNNSCARFIFVYDGPTSATDYSYNGHNEIVWGSTGGSLATTVYWYSGSNILECDIVYDDSYTWCTDGSAGEYDIQNIATHELGHWLNLRDIYGDIGDEEYDTAKTMYGFGATGETKKRTLHADDISGIRWIYGTGGDSWDPTDDTGSGGTTLTPTDGTWQSDGRHTLTSCDQDDWFRIYMDANYSYYFKSSCDFLATSAGHGDVIAYLYSDSSGTNQVEENDDSGGNYQFEFSYRPSTSGYYYLEINTYTSGNFWSGYIDYKKELEGTPPLITTHPQSQTINYNTAANLSVTATGTGPLSYQWYQGSSGDTSTPVGTNSSSYTTPNLTSTTSYWVRVSNTYGTDDSDTATIIVNPPSVPEINIKYDTTNIPDGGSFDFGSHSLGTDTDVTFTIENTGTADLILSGSPIITITGADADQFSVQQQPTSPISDGGGSTTFIIRFSPISEGFKEASISIVNNDGDENPYDISLEGTGVVLTGSLTVTIEPQGAIDAGARWKRLCTTTWYDSGYTENDIPEGNVIVEFKEVAGWLKPDDQIVSIIAGDTAEVTGIFVQLTGSGVFVDSGQSLGDSWSDNVALGDLDGDGDLDAFVANHGAQKVWLNDGSGTFTDSGQSLGTNYSYSVALGDLDCDGDLDAFVGNWGSNKVWLNDGSGTFTDSGQNLGSSDSVVVTLGDLDCDGDLDAFAANYGAHKVWLNDGSGTFTDSGQSLGDSSCYGMALGDVDNDGDLDAFICNRGPADEVWLNDGSGTFTDSGQSLGSSESMDVVLGDLDGDGDLDAYVASFSNQDDKVWLNNGSGTFTDSGQILGSSGNSGVALGDVDGDGDLDAFVAKWLNHTNSVWLNDGSGVFTDSGQSLGDSWSADLALGDVDGDGDLDAFVANGYNTPVNKVWLNSCISPEITEHPQSQSISYNTTATLNVTATSINALSYQWYQGDSGDTSTPVGTDSDSYTTPNLTETTSYWVRVSNVCGSVDSDTATVTVNLPPEQEINIRVGDNDIPDEGIYDFGTCVVGDYIDVTFTIENTGAADLTLSGSPIITITGPDSDQYNVQQQPTSPVTAGGGSTTFTIRFSPGSEGFKEASISIGNNDADEDPYDITLEGTGVAAGSLTVTIEPQGAIDAGAQWKRLCTTTWHDSGYEEGGLPEGDVIVEFKDVPGWLKPANQIVSIPAVLSGIYTQLFGSGTFVDSGQSLGSGTSNGVAFGDLDGDGDLDAFVANSSNQANKVWLNDGSGTFTDSGQSLGSGYSFCVVLGDLDSDGDLDAFVLNDGSNKVWMNDGSGTFTDSGQSLGSGYSWGAMLGDVDCDGDLDAFVANHGEANKVWMNDGSGTFSDSGQSLGSNKSMEIGFGDLDSDGDLDAFVANAGNEANKVWMNDGSGTFTDTGQSLGSAWSLDVELGDVDGDGDLDAFIANSSNQANKVWLNDGSGTFTDSGQSLGNFTSLGLELGDVDGDGDLDAFIANSLNQANKVWLNDGTGTFTDSGQSLGSYSSKKVAIGDVDGDGDLDALVANSGGNKLWLNICISPEISEHPQSQTIDYNATANLSVTASSASPISYQWYQGTSGDTSNPVGTDSDSYTTPNLTETTSYWVRVSNECGSVDSDTATICVLPTIPIYLSPSDGATDILLDSDLDWEDSSGATSYDVYFGTSSPPQYVNTVTESYYDPGPLDACSTYFWKVVAKNDCGETHGEEWSFTTIIILPEPFSNLAPSNGATDVALDIDLDWEDSSGAASYDVYFGESSPPPYLTTVAESFYDPGELKSNTTYHWYVVAKNSCGDTPGDEWSFTTGKKSWTFMVYLDGDNNLEGAGINDFLEMASVGSNAQINIVIQFDRIDGYNTSYGNWTTTKRFYITSGMTPTADNALEDLGELNHGDPQTLIDFIDWAKADYAAEKYALILWNHGGGWRESKEKEEQAKLEGKDRPYYRAVCWDDTDEGDTLYMDEVQGALDVTGSNHLIGFDACLMGMVEVAYEIKDYGEVMVGSEESEPGDGWPYDTILQDLVNNPSWSSSELGQAIVNRYYESYGEDETQSVIDLTAMDSLAGSISSFAQSLMDNWNTDVSAVKNSASEVITEIENAVIHEQHGSDWPGANGLAVYFPLTSGDFDSDYESVIDFADDTQWEEFLQEFYNFMAGSWIFQRRSITQQFGFPEHVDLYHFCELLNTETEDYYTRSEISPEYLGGGTGWNFHYDEASRTYTLPFDFPYFGETIPAGTTIYVCTNGYVDLNDFNIDYSNSGQELADNKRIAPCWIDLRTNGSAQSGEDVYITENADSLVIRWVAQTYYGAVPVNVELILYDDGRIQFNYAGGNDLSATPYSPTIGISKGDGINCYFAAHNGQKVLTDVDSAVFTPISPEPPPLPVNPSPAHEATDVSVEMDLDWDDCIGATSYDVYLGTSSPPPFVTTVSSSYYDPGTLNEGTTYYWKVVAKNDYGETHGVEWSFTTEGIQQYTLTIAAGSGGTTNPSPGSYAHDAGTNVSVTAIPNSGYHFSGWSGDASGTTETITITMDSNKSITASFASDSPGGGGGGDDGGDGGGGGCFIATAAYGSPLHPHIDILRDFRDRYLMTNALGRKFVAMYYKYSPFVAERIAKYKILKVVVRIQLLPLVALSYSTVYFGPIMTAFVFVFIFMLPVFLFPYSRKKCRGTKT